MGQSVLRKILANIKSLWFSVLADEATDIAHNEQLAISGGSVKNIIIYEDTIGFVQLPDTKGDTVFRAIISCSLPLSQCRGQALL